MGDAEEVHTSETRQKILTAMEGAAEPWGPKEICQHSDVAENTVSKRLPGLIADGKIVKVSRGLYVAASRTGLLEAAKRAKT
jgi:predicted transcriptional regulator